MADSTLDNFCAITGADRDRGRFFLDAAGGNLQIALDSFYSQDVSLDDEDLPELVQPHEATTPSDPPAIPQPSFGNSSSNKSGRSGHGGGIASLADYRSSGGNEKEDDDEDKGQEFFAGGSEHSGQMISGPPKKKRDIAKDMFDAAKKQGAVPLEEIEKDKKPSKFIGTGFRLGDTEGPSDTIPGLSISSTSRVTRTLTFWSGGFTVDHGPLRTGDTQQDKDFLDSVSKGEIPQELLKDARGREININLEDKRNETFKPKLVPFSGSGQKLGNLTPDFSPSTITQGATPTPQSAPPPPPTVTLDTSQPVTSVQIRLADGTRLVAKFNHFHTIQDIRQYIISARPEMAARDFTLQTTFPNKVLTDMSQSLVEANLLNAVVVQRFQ